jgi:flagellar FliJ protein
VKRFHFRLERLLDIRSYRERQWLAKLAAASENGEAARGAFYIDPRRGQELDLSLLTYREHYINRLGQEQVKLKEELEEKMRQRARVMSKYQEVSRDKKVLEKLKDKRESDYYDQARLEEFKEVDDMNSSQFIRKSQMRGVEP